MRDSSAGDRLRSIKAFRDYEQRGETLGERGLGVETLTAPADEVSALRVLAAVREHGSGGVRRSALAQELHATPTAVETALLRLLKEGLVTIQPGGEGDAVIVTAP